MKMFIAFAAVIGAVVLGVTAYAHGAQSGVQMQQVQYPSTWNDGSTTWDCGQISAANGDYLPDGTRIPVSVRLACDTPEGP